MRMPKRRFRKPAYLVCPPEQTGLQLCASHGKNRPLGAWLMDYPLAGIGLLTLMISMVAMGWNMLFNAAFDHAQRRIGFDRTLAVRAAHSVILKLACY